MYMDHHNVRFWGGCCCVAAHEEHNCDSENQKHQQEQSLSSLTSEFQDRGINAHHVPLKQINK